MRIFVDANVLVSVLNKEYPLFTSAARIVSLADNPRFQVYTSPICLAIAFYFSEKRSGTMRAKEKISFLGGKLKMAVCNQETVRLASADSAVNDFEDGLEYYSALKAGCKAIITEDVNDFYFSAIPVMNCETFIDSLN